MSLIASEDYSNKRIFLSADSVGVDVLPIDIYREHRARRRLNANNERNFSAMILAFGNEQIGAAKFTPRFTNLASGVKIVPYDTTHALRIRAALISVQDQLEGADLFDRSSLLASVDIDYQPPQVEIITVPTGGALTSEQDSRLTAVNALASRLNAMLGSSGAYDRWLATALELGPSGGGGGAGQDTLDAIAAILANTSYSATDGAFTAGDRASLQSTRDRVLAMNKALGREQGISATVMDAAEGEPGYLVTSDGAVGQVLTLNEDGSVTIENAPD